MGPPAPVDPSHAGAADAGAAAGTPAGGPVTGLSVPGTPFSVFAASAAGTPAFAPRTPFSLSPGSPHHAPMTGHGHAVAPGTPISVSESAPGTPLGWLAAIGAALAPAPGTPLAAAPAPAPGTPFATAFAPAPGTPLHAPVVAAAAAAPALVPGHFPVSYGSYYAAVHDGRMRVVRVMEPGNENGKVTAVPCTRTRLRTFRMDRPAACEMNISDLQLGPFGCAAGRPPKYVWSYLRDAQPALAGVPEDCSSAPAAALGPGTPQVAPVAAESAVAGKGFAAATAAVSIAAAAPCAPCAAPWDRPFAASSIVRRRRSVGGA